MVYTKYWHQRSWKPEMTVEKFIEENVDELEDYIAYQEDTTAEEIHNKQINLQAEYEFEIVDLMKELYEEYLLSAV